MCAVCRGQASYAGAHAGHALRGHALRGHALRGHVHVSPIRPGSRSTSSQQPGCHPGCSCILDGIQSASQLTSLSDSQLASQPFCTTFVATYIQLLAYAPHKFPDAHIGACVRVRCPAPGVLTGMPRTPIRACVRGTSRSNQRRVLGHICAHHWVTGKYYAVLPLKRRQSMTLAGLGCCKVVQYFASRHTAEPGAMHVPPFNC
eukprot:349954-Chlamydomonas_euryale.AAC.6